MKRNKFYEIAKKMYVENFITEAEIGNRLGVSDRTIRRWKATGAWGMDKDKFYKENTVSKDTMYALARKMLDDFHKDLDNHYNIDPSRLNIFLNLLEEILKQDRQNYKLQELIKIVNKAIDFDKEIPLDFRTIMIKDIFEDF